MNLEELKEMLKDENTIKSVMEMIENEDYFTIEKPKDNKLETYLKSLNNNIIKNIYSSYTYIDNEKKHYKKNVDKDDMIKILLKRIPILFKEYLETSITSEESKMFKEIIEKNKTTIKNPNLLALAFIFEVKDSNKKIYVVSDELREIYIQDFSEDNFKKIIYSKIDTFSIGYLTVNGIVPKDFLEDVLINNYKLDVDKNELREYLTNKFEVYKDYYTSFKNGKENINEELIKLKENKPYKVFTEDEVLIYPMYIFELIEEIAKIIKNNNEEIKSKLFVAIHLSGIEVEDIVSSINDLCKLNKNQLVKITNLIDKEIGNIINYGTNGYTIDEYYKNEIIDNYSLSKLPKNNSFNEIIKVLPKDMLEHLCSLYNCDKEKLSENIIEDFNEYLESLDDDEVYFLEEDYNDNNIDSISYKDIENGYIYIYKKDEEIKVIVPQELEDILKKSNSGYANDELILIILEYLKINGLIEIQTLLTLLNDNHDANMSYNELLDLLNLIGVKKIGRYCSLINDLDKDIIKEYIDIKKNVGYKIVDLDNLDKCDALVEELEKYLDKTTKYSDDEKHLIIENAVVGTRHGVFTKEAYCDVLNDTDIHLSKKELSDVETIVNKYKNHIGTWTYNGYTISEYNRMLSSNKTTKIGRNDICPCGSGKKYKKCCGK